MAVVLVEGFDLYNGNGTNTGLQSKWLFNLGGTSFSLVTGRFAGQGLSVNASSGASTGSYTRALPASYSAGTIGFAIRMTALPTAATTGVSPIQLLSGTTSMLGLTFANDGSIQAVRQSTVTAGTLLGTSSSPLLLNTWHYLEVEFVISDTVGVFNIYLDGVSVLALSAQDTRNGTPTTVNTVFLGKESTTGGRGTFTVDDMYLTDSAARLGERRVETIYPNADSTPLAWTPSTGTDHYSLVDEATVSTVDYVSGSTVGDTDTYDFGALASTPAAIDAVQVSVFAQKTDASSRSIALRVDSGGTASDGSNYALAASYAKFERLLTEDPNGNVPWSVAAVNALKAGPKVTV